MRTATKLLLLSLAIVFTACQKEVDYATGNNTGNTGGTGGTGNTNNIEGEYDFVGTVAHTESLVTVSIPGQELKTLTVSDYATQNNTGTMKVTADQIIYTNLGFTIDTMMNVKTYVDNVLFDDSDVPFSGTQPASSSTSPYVRNSADSITVTGTVGVASGPSNPAPTGPVGVKLSWSGDTLVLKINSSFTQTVTENGETGILVGSVNGTSKFKKH